jgi:hypothetical protein
VPRRASFFLEDATHTRVTNGSALGSIISQLTVCHGSSISCARRARTYVTRCRNRKFRCLLRIVSSITVRLLLRVGKAKWRRTYCHELVPWLGLAWLCS